ncbi:MAG: ATP-binding cassette domain-containing protein [Rhodospirillales bacterium]
MFSVSNVSKHFGDVRAVDNVSYSLSEPQMVGIIGRSGAGKSTLLRVLNRLADATSGEVCFEGVRIYFLSKGLEKENGKVIVP